MINFCGGVIASNKSLVDLKKERDRLDKLNFFDILNMFYYLPFRLISSYWDSRGSQTSKFLIDKIDKIIGSLGRSAKDSKILSRFKFNPVAAYISLVQIKNLKKEIKMRKRIAYRFIKLFENKNDFKLQKILPHSDPALSYFAILQKNARKNRIENTSFWRAWRPYGKNTPFAKKLSDNLLILPINPYYKKENILRISKQLI